MTEMSTDTVWNKLTALCKENNNRYRFKTEDGDYVLKYNGLGENTL